MKKQVPAARLGHVVREYIRHRRERGLAFRKETDRLGWLLRTVGDVPLDEVTAEGIERYLQGNGPATKWWRHKRRTIDSFYRFAIRLGYVTHSPLADVAPPANARMEPYIYTVEEVKRLLTAADLCHKDVWVIEPQTMRMLILLLYGTGMRISEAIKMKLSDADLGEGVLTVRRTKFYKTRLVPLGRDLLGVLRRYRAGMAKRWPCGDDAPLLVDRRGLPLPRQTCEVSFRKLREHAKVVREPGTAYEQPRPHDFRHTFAVNRMVTWYREGKNVQRLLPHLSTYLGHYEVGDTQRYLSMTADLLAEAGDRFLRYAEPSNQPRHEDVQKKKHGR